MPSPEYSRLLPSPQVSESDDIELMTVENSGWLPTITATSKISPGWLSESTAWKGLILTLILSLAISAVNLTFLSARNALLPPSSGSDSAATSQQLEYPNPYIGLERAARDPSRCLSRRTFLDTFFMYDAREGPRATLTHVHAPEDEVTLVFGGQIRAVIEAYVPDYGLENCTLIVHSSNATHPGQGRSVDVYLLPTGKPGDGPRANFLNRLAFIPGKDSTSRPFHCPSRSHVHFELRCDEDDCMVQIPLQGVTSKTASSIPASSLKTMETGFRLNQHEAVDYIGGVRAEEEVQM
ncbi:hypothetical protein V8D89_008730 [Ganoderma adspersum]